MQAQPLRNFEVRMSAILKATNLTKKFKSPQETTVLDGISLEVFPWRNHRHRRQIRRRQNDAPASSRRFGRADIGHRRNLRRGCNSPNKPAPSKQPYWICISGVSPVEECTVLENVLMPARIAKHDIRPGSPAHNRALTLLHEVGIGHRAIYPAKLLSGGEKQRVA